MDAQMSFRKSWSRTIRGKKKVHPQNGLLKQLTHNGLKQTLEIIYLGPYFFKG